ncbi:unnamed protein product [Meloidogyne enterolobii]|uniref:Uncharacterized protein n=1 Tax=Meloidogyne enterolobii TaxID=390850 RepID=A0ACB0XLD3_MELEN
MFFFVFLQLPIFYHIYLLHSKVVQLRKSQVRVIVKGHLKFLYAIFVLFDFPGFP